MITPRSSLPINVRTTLQVALKTKKRRATFEDFVRALSIPYPNIKTCEPIHKGRKSSVFKITTIEPTFGKRKSWVLKCCTLKHALENPGRRGFNQKRIGGEAHSLLDIFKTVTTYHAIAFDRASKTFHLIDRAQVNAYLNHPELLEHIDSVVVATISKYYPGSQTLQSLKKVPDDDLQNYAKQLIEATQAVHSFVIGNQCLIHRDIKPANILITREKELLLLDFDFSRFITIGEKRKYTLCGTTPYMAPEIFFRETYDKTIDYCSIAYTFFFMATGKLIASEENELLHFHLTSPGLQKHPELEEFHDQPFLSLLKRLSESRSSNRISLTEALNHPYFSDFIR